MQDSSIIILGGGVIGLATAFELAKRGKQVTLLEKEKCGGQATGAAAGMLAPYSEIGEDPDDFFRLCQESLKMYPTWQREVKQASELDFEYNPSGSLHAVFHEADLLTLETRKSWQQRFGVEAEIIQGERLRKLEPHLSAEVKAAMYYPGEQHIYAPDYVQALIRACQLLGVQLVEDVGETDFQEINTHSILIQTEKKGSFSAEQCIVCNGAWTNFLESTLQLKLPIFPIRGQICAYQQGPEKIQHMIFSSQGYVVAKGDGSIVCGASEDIAGYNNSVSEKGIERLKKWSKRLFPFLAEQTPLRTWAGLRPATQDGYPLIGRLEHYSNIIIASGHYRNGILLSPINAHIVANLIEHKQPSVPIQQFNPHRFS